MALAISAWVWIWVRRDDPAPRVQLLAGLLIEAALFRAESRGGHHRTDAPAPQPFWQRHTLQQKDRAIHTESIGGSDQKLRGPL